jgi:hypothetical protein
MKKVAVFGNAGAGKSTLAKRLAQLTGLPLYPLDLIQYRPGGAAVPQEEYLKAHAELLRKDEWIIDGFGSVASAWERFAEADTLIYIDLPVATHYLWVTKRLIKGLFRDPGRLARGQPDVEEHHGQLQGDLALPSRPDPELPAAGRRRRRVETGSSLKVAGCDRGLSGGGQA